MIVTTLSTVAFAEDKKVTVEISLWEIENFGNDAVSDYLEEKFNCEIVPILQEWSDYTSKFATWAVADTLPDCFAGYPLSESWYTQFVADENIREIPIEMLEKYPTLYGMCQSSYEWNISKDMYDGKIYYIPRMLSAGGNVVGIRSGFMYRKDWAEKLGFAEAPTNMDAVYDILYAFAHNDPDGNGADDTYGLVGKLDNLYNAFDAYPGCWVKTDKGYVPGWLDEEAMIEALTWFRKAYENGVIDPEFSADRTKWTQGTFGAFYTTNIDAYWLTRYLDEEMGGAHPELGDPLEYIGTVAVFSAHEGGVAHIAPSPDASGTVFAYDTTDEQLECLLSIYDWLLTDEGNLFRYWGFEGEDYEIKDGIPTLLHDESLRAKYPSIFIQNWPSWDHDFLNDTVAGDPTKRLAIKERAIEMRTAANAACDLNGKVSLAVGYLTSEEKRDFVFDYAGELAQIITDTEDVAAMYNAMVERAYEAGIQDVIDSINEQV